MKKKYRYLKKSFNLLTLTILMILVGCISQNNKTMNTKNNNNPLLCDTDSGICETSNENTEEPSKKSIASGKNAVKIIYFTDPICSSCWGIEPQIRKLKLTYGNQIDIEYRMGGLLPDWSYSSGGISKPSDVAHHWDEASQYYEMPIDGDVWLEDPLNSSYPPSIAFKAAQIQDDKKAIVFLRKLRELLFLKKKNITKWEVIKKASEYSKLNTKKLEEDYNGIAKILFQKDLELAKQLGVRGFPTMFFVSNENKYEIVYGAKPYSAYKKAVEKTNPKVVEKKYNHSAEYLLNEFFSLTIKEYEVIANLKKNEAKQQLKNLFSNNKATKVTTKNGDLYHKK